MSDKVLIVLNDKMTERILLKKRLLESVGHEVEVKTTEQMLEESGRTFEYAFFDEMVSKKDVVELFRDEL